ncbi:MAG: GTPase/DUF3482 domain-containing protein [Planctomycetota bacterium]
MSDPLPRFVVVGNVNQGKSSVVAALTEDEAVPIDSYPGTTRRCGEYLFRVGANGLFQIIDTPGFQRARQLLARLLPRAQNAVERPRAVRQLLADPGFATDFPDEAQLLAPIVDGAGILYVVDASSPVEPSNEAEMEILRWTGQPAMALLNRVRARDHSEHWRPVLRQFFHTVREFDAHHARFPDRVALLRGFREIRPEWSASIDAAVAAMEREWSERGRRAASAVADLLGSALSHVERKPLAETADEKAVRAALHAAFLEAQRRMEKQSRQRIEEVYRHPGLEADDKAIEILHEDLFSETTWRVFGLTRRQLATYMAVGGAIAGGTIDVMLGGISFGAFAALSGLGAGALGSLGWLGGERLAVVKSNAGPIGRALFPGDTGRFVSEGPVRDLRYAWVLLDRALVHFREVRDRSHARRDHTMRTGDARGVVAELPRASRDALQQALKRLLDDARSHGNVGGDARRELEARIHEVMQVLPSSS